MATLGHLKLTLCANYGPQPHLANGTFNLAVGLFIHLSGMQSPCTAPGATGADAPIQLSKQLKSSRREGHRGTSSVVMALGLALSSTGPGAASGLNNGHHMWVILELKQAFL